ncbi:GNAT family N-acetyltransferase [Dactylosporangium sp. NPDC005555]|uniref:GNAT family N-acetyltransferase n=1 Tax=Dactylosporangium sp. NPDC005555 TaxID=3154889 RepID=UPI0033A60CA4
MKVRAAVAEDAEALVRLHQEARRTYYGDLDVPDDTARLCEAYTISIQATDRLVLCVDAEDGRPAGFLSLGPPARLVGLYVDPAHWARGIGGALHDAGVAAWHAAGVTEGLLEVWDGNARAKAFYLRRGWRPDGERRDGPLGRDFVDLRLTIQG